MNLYLEIQILIYNLFFIKYVLFIINIQKKDGQHYHPSFLLFYIIYLL